MTRREFIIGATFVAFFILLSVTGLVLARESSSPANLHDFRGQPLIDEVARRLGPADFTMAGSPGSPYCVGWTNRGRQREWVVTACRAG